jgi:branched-chain amino acid transport system ATP-binding protein
MSRPRLLLLDEPSLGLAPRLTAQLLARLAEVAAGGTAVLLAEQNAAAALDVCGRGVVLRLGKVAATGAAAALRQDLAGALLGPH